jgi:hypothetical protein
LHFQKHMYWYFQGSYTFNILFFLNW